MISRPICHSRRTGRGGEDGFVNKLVSPPPNRYYTDFNGDGTSEAAIFRRATGLWAIRGVSRIYFGSGGDEAVPADYNGDNSDSPGIFRSASGLWAVQGITRTYFGGSSDIPVTR